MQPQVTILFADIVGFTTMCDAVDAEAMVNLLHILFSALDEATGRHSVFKVDTIGERICPPPCRASSWLLLCFFKETFSSTKATW